MVARAEDFAEDTKVDDEAAHDSTVVPVQYNITSFGADYDVEGLVKRLRRGDIFIPPFQRDYVWKQAEASRLIESLLLGLPVPGVFLAKEADTNKLLVIDGQQRLKSLEFFYDGYFNPKAGEKHKPFTLIKVQPQFEGKVYEKLEESDRIKLDNSIIHATIIKQDSPKDGDTSIYHVFERLNNGGRKLTPQEIRVAIYHGDFIDAIKALNELKEWRAIFGKKHERLKDQELILRFLAMYFASNDYQKPMNEFLNKFTETHRKPTPSFIAGCRKIFSDTITFVHTTLANKAFRLERALNVAVFDSVMFGLAQRQQRKNSVPDANAFKQAYQQLLSDQDYLDSVSQATSDERTVARRLQIATRQFAEL
jgi:uncharacterized protein with ParB-like and HNH nuclease domain